MKNKNLVILCLALIACFVLVGIASAAEESGAKTAKNFWQKLFNYPANVTKESANVVADTGTKSTGVVTDEVKRVGQVTSGDIDKTKDLVTEPLVGTAQTAKEAVEKTAAIPVTAAKEEQSSATK